MNEFAPHAPRAPHAPNAPRTMYKSIFSGTSLMFSRSTLPRIQKGWQVISDQEDTTPRVSLAVVQTETTKWSGRYQDLQDGKFLQKPIPDASSVLVAAAAASAAAASASASASATGTVLFAPLAISVSAIVAGAGAFAASNLVRQKMNRHLSDCGADLYTCKDWMMVWTSVEGLQPPMRLPYFLVLESISSSDFKGLASFRPPTIEKFPNN
jgi:hypothetical protein